MPLIDSAEQLVNVVDHLLGQHRAGINPHFGQLEDLRDWSTRVRQDLDAARAPGEGGAAATPSVDGVLAARVYNGLVAVLQAEAKRLAQPTA